MAEAPTWINDIGTYWPNLGWLVPIAFVAYYGVRFLSLMYEPVEGLLGKLGTHWREQAERRQVKVAGEIGALRTEVASLSDKVNALQQKDEIYWSYVLYDEEWHRKRDFEAVQSGAINIHHISFPEFRARWLRERKVSEEDDFWK